MTFFVPLRLAYNSRCPKTCDTKLGGAVLNKDIQEKGIKLNHSCLFTDEVNYTNVGNLFFFTIENSVNCLFIGNAVILLPLFVHLIVKLFIISYLYRSISLITTNLMTFMYPLVLFVIICF